MFKKYTSIFTEIAVLSWLVLFNVIIGITILTLLILRR